MTRYAYYPGCSLETTAIEYDVSLRAVCNELGIELHEIDDWSCCGASASRTVDAMLNNALSLRNLALAEKAKADVVITACSACFNNLRKADKGFKEDESLAKEMNKAIKGTGLRYKGKVEVKHILDVIVNDIGLDEVSKRVKRDLSALKVAPYYGCWIVKPEEVANFDRPEDPQAMDSLLKAIGAEIVPYREFKTRCCGGTIVLTEEGIAKKLSYDLLLAAKERGADLVVDLCPMCHFMLDAKQPGIKKEFGLNSELPVLYFTQLLGLALGIDAKELALEKNIISLGNVLEKIEEPRVSDDANKG